MTKISLLIPVYGVEQHIAACATSLFEQTYDNLEYIFVDDCSPDNSIAILQEVASRYSHRRQQMSIIRHKRNRGLGAARATALNAATGDFVMVVDSDDLLTTDAVATLYRKQQETGADIIDGAFCYLYPDGPTAPRLPFHGTKEHLLRLMLLQNTVPHMLWGRLVRRSTYTDNGINSIEGVNMAEDYAVTPRLLCCGTRAWTDETVYYYRMNAQSTFADSMEPRHLHSYLTANRVTADFITSHDTQGHYRQALQTGRMLAFYNALKGGMRLTDIEVLCGQRLPVFERLLCHRPLLPLLRLCYLLRKRILQK